ncbi:MAG: P63C domain-containing protein [Acidobacteria bacterium]|nr:P63C domain-containing protein [Acidobacteriota bacterium]
MDDPKDEKKVKAGIARAQALSDEERREIARKAAAARWHSDLPQATHQGEIDIGGAKIPCYVLKDGTRVLARVGVLKAIGRKGKAKGGRQYDDEFQTPVFLTAENLRPFIPKEIESSSKPIIFIFNGVRIIGYKAELLPQICEVFIDAKDAKALHQNQQHIADACKILYRGFARVSIIALVDEATGYQYDRARKALEEILQKFISKELLRWVKTFPDEFYEQIYRLKGWRMSENGSQRTPLLGKITNDLVYERLAPGVLDELRRLTPRNEKGRLKHKLFRRLTEDVGHPKLREHLASEITLMRIFEDGDWTAFYKSINKALPKQTKLPLFDKADGLEPDE